MRHREFREKGIRDMSFKRHGNGEELRQGRESKYEWQNLFDHIGPSLSEKSTITCRHSRTCKRQTIRLSCAWRVYRTKVFRTYWEKKLELKASPDWWYRTDCSERMSAAVLRQTGLMLHWTFRWRRE